jgi:flavorubredoxin
MNAMVIYDSKFGNTERIAKAIGDALADELNVRVQAVGDTAAIPGGLELLVIGGPTHAHGMSGPMRAFLEDIPADALRDVPALAFDTRFRMPTIISGTAASGIGKALRRKGAKILLRPASFFVSRVEGNPLEPGEQERASEWARDIVALLAHAV